MVTPTHTSDNYSDQGGNEYVVGPGGSILIQVGGAFYESTVDNLTAHAGGGQANALPLTALMNRVTTVASAADSVLLPPSVAGLTVTVTNASATAMQVFGTSPDTINGVATGTGVSLAAGKTANYCCYTAGAWHQLLSA